MPGLVQVACHCPSVQGLLPKSLSVTLLQWEEAFRTFDSWPRPPTVLLEGQLYIMVFLPLLQTLTESYKLNKHLPTLYLSHWPCSPDHTIPKPQMQRKLFCRMQGPVPVAKRARIRAWRGLRGLLVTEMLFFLKSGCGYVSTRFTHIFLIMHNKFPLIHLKIESWKQIKAFSNWFQIRKPKALRESQDDAYTANRRGNDFCQRETWINARDFISVHSGQGCHIHRCLEEWWPVWHGGKGEGH